MKTAITLTDNQTLTGATSKAGHSIPTYDDGDGLLWAYQDSFGLVAIVRAKSFETAYSIVEDEFLPEATDTLEDIVAEYGFRVEYLKIIRPRDGGPERVAAQDDYPLEAGQFVRWDRKETPDPDAWADNPLFQEAYGFRPNGPNVRDKHQHGIYAKDLNGEYMALLTEELGVALNITTNE